MPRVWIVVIVLVVVLGVMALRLAGGHYECPKCGARFRVGFLRYVVAPHALGKREVTCPECGTRAYLGLSAGRIERHAPRKDDGCSRSRT